MKEKYKPSKKELRPNPLMRQFNLLKLIEGGLHRVTTVDEEVKCQLVLPLEHVPIALEAMHNDMERPYNIIGQRSLLLVRNVSGHHDLDRGMWSLYQEEVVYHTTCTPGQHYNNNTTVISLYGLSNLGAF